jgi:hypothetical protein
MRSRTIFAAFVTTASLCACTPSGATNTPTIGARAPSEELVFIRQPEPGTAQTRIETLEVGTGAVSVITPDGSVRRACRLAWVRSRGSPTAQPGQAESGSEPGQNALLRGVNRINAPHRVQLLKRTLWVPGPIGMVRA